ncbi:hypothetical protein OIV83_002718 [Microbotryomycetes sp. JL201]|nr:hypothetical protein OIV83_002718 [Microbotryomycetes sp. JL201]
MTSLRPLSVSSPRSLTSPKPSYSSTHSTSPRLGSSTASDAANNRPAGSPSLGAASSQAQSSSKAIGLGLGVAVAEDAKAEVTSPVELTQFVDNLLNDLESRFDAISSDVLSRLNSLSTRVDSLESSLSELMSGNSSAPPRPDSKA